MLPWQRILCPTDFSEPSLAAIDVACAFAAEFDAELFVLHVARPRFPLETEVAAPAGDEDEYEHAEREKLIQRLHEIVRNRVAPGIVAHCGVAFGNPAEEIVRVAEAEGAELIVIATHGTTGWRHLVFGSVTEKVLHKAKAQVLVVPIQQPGGVEHQGLRSSRSHGSTLSPETHPKSAIEVTMAGGRK